MHCQRLFHGGLGDGGVGGPACEGHRARTSTSRRVKAHLGGGVPRVQVHGEAPQQAGEQFGAGDVVRLCLFLACNEEVVGRGRRQISEGIKEEWVGRREWWVLKKNALQRRRCGVASMVSSGATDLLEQGVFCSARPTAHLSG